MTDPADRRSKMIDRMADFVLTNGLAAATLRPLAAAAGLSDRMLLYHFQDKAAVMTAVLNCLTQRLTAQLTAQASATPQPAGRLRRRLTVFATRPEILPYMHLWLEIATRAARGDALCLAVGRDIGQGFLGWIAAQTDGGTPSDAMRLLTLLEGHIVLTSIGLTAPEA